MAVLDAQGATLTVDSTAATPVATTIGGIISFAGFDGEASDIDITTLDSTAKEFRQGLQDFGNFTIELNRDPTDAGQVALEANKAAQATTEFVLTLASGEVATFDGYVKSLSSSGAVDEVLRGTCNVKVTGSVVWT